MKVQQAPSPVQADLSLPEIVASAIAQLKTGGTIRTNAATTSKVRRVFEIELKRLRRSQCTMNKPPPGEPSKRPLGGAIFIYLTIAEALFGSTIGKGLFGLGVGRRDGGRLGFARALVRNIVLPLDLAVIGFFLAAVTPSRARIGDFVAGSVVANARTGRLAIVSAALIGVGGGKRLHYAVVTTAGALKAPDLGDPEEIRDVSIVGGRIRIRGRARAMYIDLVPGPNGQLIRK